MQAPEPAVKHIYDWRTGTWQKQNITVAIDMKPFQAGTLRVIFHMMDYSLPEGQQEVVAKLSKDPNENPRSYFQDVEMQGKAKYFAEKFNARRPPKKIDFVVPYIVEFKKRPSRNGMGKLVMGVEPYISGHYKKHSNNFGFVDSEDRNTPAAFSHFTYQESGGKLMVVDIQGVADIYTDPQIHTASGPHKYGKADMGPQGIQKFFSTHLCNAICQYLKLSQVGGRKRIDFSTALTGGVAGAQNIPAGSPLTPSTPLTPSSGGSPLVVGQQRILSPSMGLNSRAPKAIGLPSTGGLGSPLGSPLASNGIRVQSQLNRAPEQAFLSR